MKWEDDVSPAVWIAPRLHAFGQDTGSVVPEGFESYARIFHPVDLGDGSRRRWAEVARSNGRIVHPEMQLHMISRAAGTPLPREYELGQGFQSGSLPMPERSALIDLLRPVTATPEACWFCVWEGFGSVHDDGVRARVQLPHRAYLLAGGPVEAAVSSFGVDPWDQSPNLWWPDDRAWVVATEVDYAWTYVGGSHDLVEQVLADPRLEALPARLTDKPFYDSDVLNAGP